MKWVTFHPVAEVYAALPLPTMIRAFVPRGQGRRFRAAVGEGVNRQRETGNAARLALRRLTVGRRGVSLVQPVALAR